MTKDYSQRVKVVDQSLDPNSFEKTLKISRNQQKFNLSDTKRRPHNSNTNINTGRNTKLATIKKPLNTLRFNFPNAKAKYNSRRLISKFSNDQTKHELETVGMYSYLTQI